MTSESEAGATKSDTEIRGEVVNITRGCAIASGAAALGGITFLMVAVVSLIDAIAHCDTLTAPMTMPRIVWVAFYFAPLFFGGCVGWLIAKRTA